MGELIAQGFVAFKAQLHSIAGERSLQQERKELILFLQYSMVDYIISMLVACEDWNASQKQILEVFFVFESKLKS